MQWKGKSLILELGSENKKWKIRSKKLLAKLSLCTTDTKSAYLNIYAL